MGYLLDANNVQNTLYKFSNSVKKKKGIISRGSPTLLNSSESDENPKQGQYYNSLPRKNNISVISSQENT